MPGPRPKYAIELTEPQVAALTHVSASYTAPCAHVQRARILLLAHQRPAWNNHQIAQAVASGVDTVRVWRQRWQQEPTLADRPRTGAPRTFPRLVRTQIVALACTQPRDHGKVWQRWSSEKLAQVAVEKGIVTAISPSTIRRWLRQDRLKPWRYHSWQHSTDPQFVEKASPVLDLYEQAQGLAQQGEAVCTVDEKTAIQARQRVSATKAAAPDAPVQVADRYRRMGAVHLFCALMVATGLTCGQCLFKRTFADFKAFL
jgi:transposase